MSLRKQFSETVTRLAASNSNLVVIVGDISHGIFSEFREKYGDRYFNIGILEPTMVGVSAGMSKIGLNPVVHTIAPFLIERSFEQIKLDFGYQLESVNLVSVGGTFDYSQLGVSHHSYSDVSLMTQIPGSRVFVPGSEVELEKLFSENFETPGVKYFRLTENPHNVVVSLPDELTGKSVKIRSGADVTLITAGPLLGRCAESAEKLQDVDVEILYFPTIKPFDANQVRESIKKTQGRFVVVDEFGLSNPLLMETLKSCVNLGNLVWRHLTPQTFNYSYGSYSELLDSSGLSLEQISTALVDVCRR